MGARRLVGNLFYRFGTWLLKLEKIQLRDDEDEQDVPAYTGPRVSLSDEAKRMVEEGRDAETPIVRSESTAEGSIQDRLARARARQEMG